ncbi:hypothetical protein AVEN_245831-1 [Araneus ventricosus]|uniref:Uncharacterized protein n=1 Tax=Araneus ventricosus TaxID=182803 RepID=A0A4Y2EC51_ARAVE|nr:hypothetical protein AVEN_245831-1 [Araneus ventricosus]
MEQERKGGPPNEEELADCKQIQEYESKRILTRQMLRRARKRLKRVTPNSEASMRAAKDVERFNEAMKIANEVIEMTGECPVLNCTKHPVFRKEDAIKEVEATSCTDMDTDSIIDDHELAAMTSVEGKTDEGRIPNGFSSQGSQRDPTTGTNSSKNSKYI